jgi:segregation and condensation protein B
MLQKYRRRAEQARSIKPLTPMIEEIARDLKIAVSDDGLTVAPDSAGMEADILLPAHQPYDMDIVERIVQRYEKILEDAAMNRKPAESSPSDRQSS